MNDPVTGFDPAAALAQLVAATEQLIRTASGFTDAGVRAPSLLPGWSRGHVLTHLARNADGGRRLLGWARTGVEAAEYPSLAAREEQIEAGAGRGAAELLADLRGSAAAFEAEYRRMPPEAWRRIVRWTRGQERLAARAADARLCEVLVHHADLDAGYTPAHWPADFVEAMLGRVVASLGSRADAPAMRLHATDTGATYSVGPGTSSTTATGAPSDVRAAGPGQPVIHGPQSSLLAWLMGRSPGADLVVRNASVLPEPPFLY